MQKYCSCASQTNSAVHYNITDSPLLMTKKAPMKFILLTLLAAFFATAGQAQTFQWNEPGNSASAKEVKSPAYEAAYKQVQTGFATYYADYLAGKATAYGETYQPNELTASHAVLPIGTILRVSRPDNGQAVEVRVNDKGGLCDGCVVVLSRAAAHQIGLTQTGKSRVSVERVGFSNWNPRPQRMTEQVNSRMATQPASYITTPAQPSYQNTQPVAYNPPANQGVVRPNLVATNQPDFGSLQRREVSQTAPDPQRDPVAYRPASRTDADHRGGNGFTSKGLDTDNRPAVVAREVAVNHPRIVASAVYTPPATQNESPTTYNNAAALAPLSEVQVASNKQKGYAIQLAAYSNAENAIRQVRSLQAQGIENIYVASVSRSDGSTLNRILVGPFTNRASAQDNADQIARQKQMGGIVVQLD